MSTHTPGPWVWMSDVAPIDIRTWKPKGYYDNPVLVGANGVRITGDSEYNTLSVNMIDNFMIAAAPDMLKALEGCLRVAKAHYLDMVDQYTDDDPDIEEHLRHAHPNIAAAAMEVKRLETIIYKATGDV